MTEDKNEKITVAIYKETHGQICKLGTTTESLADVIKRVVEYYVNEHKNQEIEK